MKKFVFITAVLLMSKLIVAQSDNSYKLLAKPNDKGQIQLKWFTQQLYNKDKSYTLERKVNGKFEAINQTPIQFAGQAFNPPSDEINAIKDIVDNSSYNELEGLVQLTLFIYSIKENDFSAYLGNYFLDQNPISGESTYRLLDEKDNVLAETTIDLSNFNLPKPSEVKVEAGNKFVTIDLRIESGKFYAYEIQRSEGGGAYESLSKEPFLASTDGENEYFYTDKKVENGKTYSYRISGIDYFGEKSAYTKEVAVSPVDDSAPVLPELIEVSSGEESISLSWDIKEIDKIKELTIYRSYKYDRDHQKLNNVPISPEITSFEDSPEEAGVYYYILEAVGKNGKVSRTKSNFGEIRDFTPPAIPSGIELSAESGKITISWNANTEDDFKGYWVYRSTAKDKKEFNLLTSEPIRETAFSDQLPKEAKNAFRYYIVALDTNDNKSEASEVVIGAMPDVIPPEAPFLSELEVLASSILVKWKPLSTADLERYVLIRKGESTDTIGTFSPTEITFEDKSVPKNTELTYSLFAVDSSNNYSSSSQTLTAEFAVKEKPKAVSEYELVAIEDENGVSISWPAQELDKIRGFIVYRKSDEASWKPVSNLLKEGLYKDQNLKKGINYSYQIRTYGLNGQLSLSPVQSIKLP